MSTLPVPDEPIFGISTEDLWSRIPEFYRMYDKDQSAPGPLTALPALTNYEKYPAATNVFAVGAYWGSGSGTTQVVSASWTARGTAIQATCTAASPSVICDAGVRTSSMSLTPGSTYTVEWGIVTSTDMSLNVPVKAGSNNSDTLVATSGAVSTKAGVPVRRWATIIAGAGTDARVSNNAQAQVVGSWLQISDIVIYDGVKASVDYFDGYSVPPDPRIPADTYGWDGAPDASSSHQLAYAGDPGGFPFKRFLASMGDQISSAEELLNRFYYDTPEDGGDPAAQISDLADPNRADYAWIPWLAQMIGISLKGVYGEAAQRLYLSDPSVGYLSGSRQAMASAARLALSGTQYIGVLDHTTDTSSLGQASEWDVCLVYKPEELTGDIIFMIEQAGAKPAGLKLWTREYNLTWQTFETAYPTWAALNGKTWKQVEETVPSA